jgi:hypothetical protein
MAALQTPVEQLGEVLRPLDTPLVDPLLAGGIDPALGGYGGIGAYGGIGDYGKP